MNEDTNDNLSPALASMFAQLMMPAAYLQVMHKAMMNVNSVCRASARHFSS